MSKAIYIAATESDSGKSLVSLGLLRMMLTKSSKVGYFRPISTKLNQVHLMIIQIQQLIFST